MPTPNFPHAHAAYAWAFEIRDVWRGGKAFDPDPETCGGGTGALGAVHLALDIMKIADRADIHNGHGSWFEREFISSGEPAVWSERERFRLNQAICAFCSELVRAHLLQKNACTLNRFCVTSAAHRSEVSKQRT